MRTSLYFSSAKNYFLGLATSGVILCTGFLYFDAKKPVETTPELLTKVEFKSEPVKNIQAFNPNSLTNEEWQKLGFTEKQAATILKYKNVVGGAFSSKEQLKRCYSISDDKFQELEPFILLPEVSRSQRSTFSNRRAYDYSSADKLNIRGKFNPDHYSVQDFILLGFTPKQSEAIIKYKHYLGGSFMSKQKFSECFVISPEKYLLLEPYLLLPETSPSETRRNISSSVETSKPLTKFNPNDLDTKGWQALGFSEKQSQVIINYRDRYLKNGFQSVDDVKKCFVISEEKFEELKPFMIFQDGNSGNNNQPQQSATDFSSIDLNQISYQQLIEFGFDQKSAAMLLSYRKKLGGFVTKQQIVETYDIDKSLAQKLVQIAKLDTSRVEKHLLVDAPEEWLKTHPYFKYSADKIIYHRVTNPDDKKIWKLLKLKPEYETRMKLYIREI